MSSWRPQGFIFNEQRMAGGSRSLPQPVTAIMVTNEDQNAHVTQTGPADHLSDGESSVASAFNSGPSDTGVGGRIA